MTDLSDTSTLDVGAQIRDRLIKDLREEKFVLYFQSIIPVVPAVPEPGLFREILVRFKEEERDMMPPGTFLPILEQHGLMPLLDRWVTGQSSRWVRKVKATAQHAPRCSINLSRDTVRRDGSFGDFVQQSVKRVAIEPASLSFEIPMEEVISVPQAVTRLVGSLRAAGCGVSFSGFAGEIPALELAKSLDVAFVKVDGSLVYPISRDTSAAAKLHAIQKCSRTFGVQTICTQVEDTRTLEILRAIHVNYAQGFGIDRPRLLQ
jgi:EAL domain-containing protein (putative c-di-GMP-specific phosphodiesterase class I)